MQALRQHLVHHPLHMAGCALAVAFVVTGVVLGLPILAVIGPLMCGVMMVGMVWMMVRHGHH